MTVIVTAGSFIRQSALVLTLVTPDCDHLDRGSKGFKGGLQLYEELVLKVALKVAT